MNFWLNDIGTFLATLKIGVMWSLSIGDIFNEKFLKLHTHLPVKSAFIAWIKAP